MTHAPDLRTLLLTDIVDSTALTERIGDLRMAAIWRQHDALVRDLLVRWQGQEIDRTDGFLLLFDAVAHAVGFASELHQAFAALSATEAIPFRARIGVHRGPVILLETPPAARARGAKALELEGLAKPVAARVMSLAGPGQTLLSAEACAGLGETGLAVVSHGYWRLKGATDPVEIFEVGPSGAPFTPPLDNPKAYRVLRQGAGWRTLADSGHGLPAERDAFVGREREQQALADRFESGARLVSVLGMGGVGKTRLALRFAWSRLGDFSGGAWFCDLSEARDLSGIVSAVARTLDVPLGTADPVVQLGHVIAARGSCLMVLDNLEQVVRLAGTVLGTWLDRAPKARFLVTSRALLGLPGETSQVLAPLEREEATTLFVHRAAAMDASFVPSEGDVRAIRDLVLLLDGLPLAIELAAARTSLWSPPQILGRMGDRFRVLRTGGGRQDRQATLKGALDWSWELLSADEQAALAQVSVFEGGFTVDLAEEVLHLDSDWVSDALHALVNRSLLRRRDGGRLDMLRSVHEYASLHLAARGDRLAVERRHGQALAAFGTEASLAALDTHGGVARRAVLMEEQDNLRAACRRALVRADAEIAAATALGAWAILELRGPFREGIALLSQTLELPGLSGVSTARLRLTLGRASWLSGATEEGRQHLELALDLAVASGEAGLEGQVLENLAIVDRERGRTGEAHAHLSAALRLRRARGDRSGEGAVLSHQGVLFREEGRLAEAERCYLEAADLHQEVGNRRGEAIALGNLANLLSAQRRPEEALCCFEGALAIHRELGNRRGEGVTLGNLANLHRERGRTDEARGCFEASLAIAREVGDRRAEAHVLSNLGALYRNLGRLEQARACLDGALTLAREAKARRIEGLLLANLGVLHHGTGQLDPALDLLQQALAVSREIQNPLVEGATLSHLGHLYLDRGEYDDASRSLDAAERLIRVSGDLEALVTVLCNRVVLAQRRGDSGTASAVFAEVAAMEGDLGPTKDIELDHALGRAREALHGHAGLSAPDPETPPAVGS